ncbi:MAG TPA: YoaK family protein [Mycobacterium sp.]|nr:YoaK family protein [Mycobacterium sp.]
MTDAATGPADAERSNTLWFAVLLTLTNGFLDAHTYMARGHVFANVQTANVIFSAIDVSERQFSAALAHVWPLLAFITGMLLASHIKSGRVEQVVPHSLRWTIGIQAVVLALIGFVPASVDHNVVTVPISFLAAVQIGLFRKIGDLAYLPVATTGNLMRFMESAYDSAVDKRAEARRPLVVYGTLIVAFATGAFAGAFATGALGVRAIWLPAGFLAVTLSLFLVRQREWMR